MRRRDTGGREAQGELAGAPGGAPGVLMAGRHSPPCWGLEREASWAPGGRLGEKNSTTIEATLPAEAGRRGTRPSSGARTPVEGRAGAVAGASPIRVRECGRCEGPRKAAGRGQRGSLGGRSARAAVTPAQLPALGRNADGAASTAGPEGSRAPPQYRLITWKSSSTNPSWRGSNRMKPRSASRESSRRRARTPPLR